MDVRAPIAYEISFSSLCLHEQSEFCEVEVIILKVVLLIWKKSNIKLYTNAVFVI